MGKPGDNHEPVLGEEQPGVFITFEGCEGSGKTTQADMLAEHLVVRGYNVVVAREPGGTSIGQKIRDILLDPANKDMSPMTEALLFTADRAQNIEEVVRPAVEQGSVVICDRYIDSSLAYQGVGRSIGMEPVKNLNEWVTTGFEPNLTFYLDMSPQEALERKLGTESDRIELEPPEFHENVRDAFKTLAKLYSFRIVLLDATASREAIHSRIVDEVSGFLT